MTALTGSNAAYKNNQKKRKVPFGTVYSYRNIKRVIIKHIDSGATDKEIIALKGMVRDPFPTILNNPISVWETKAHEEAVLFSQCEYIGIYYTYLYDILSAVQNKIG